MWPFKENTDKIKSIAHLHEEGSEEFDQSVAFSQPILSNPYDIRGVFREAAQEVGQKFHEYDAELLDNDKLRGYIKMTVKYLATKFFTDSSAANILVCCGDMKDFPTGLWTSFMLIFCKLCEELGISASTSSGGYIHVDRTSFGKFMDSLAKDYVINIDERVRAMLSSGPYR